MNLNQLCKDEINIDPMESLAVKIITESSQTFYPMNDEDMAIQLQWDEIIDNLRSAALMDSIVYGTEEDPVLRILGMSGSSIASNGDVSFGNSSRILISSLDESYRKYRKHNSILNRLKNVFKRQVTPEFNVAIGDVRRDSRFRLDGEIPPGLNLMMYIRDRRYNGTRVVSFDHPLVNFVEAFEISGIKEEILEKIPSLKASHLNKNTDCSICLSDVEPDELVVPLPCGHCYHDTCIKPWLFKTSTCPLCRVDVSIWANSQNKIEI